MYGSVYGSTMYIHIYIWSRLYTHFFDHELILMILMTWKNTTMFYNGIVLRLVPKRLISRWLETLKAQLLFFWYIRRILKKNHKAVRFWSIIEIFISLLHKQTMFKLWCFFKMKGHFRFKKWVPIHWKSPFLPSWLRPNLSACSHQLRGIYIPSN